MHWFRPVLRLDAGSRLKTRKHDQNPVQVQVQVLVSVLRDTHLDCQLAAAVVTALATSSRGAKGTVPKIELHTYDGSGQWQKRCQGVIFLNSLKEVALTHIDEWPLMEIQTWSFDHTVEVLRARFGLAIKQAAHRQAWHALTMGAKESLETFYDRFTKRGQVKVKNGFSTPKIGGYHVDTPWDPLLGGVQGLKGLRGLGCW